MCGICGIFDYGRSSAGFDKPLLESMSRTMVHRGPDDAGTFLDQNNRIGFGFRRLSIIDLSPAANQPMSTLDGSVTIVFNGEIYNHLVLRQELERKGYRYRSRSDTETILYSYQEFGLDFVHRLLGMFAIALWDRSVKRLVLVRDRIGVKPLYYTFSEGSCIFASEIKALLKHPAVVRELNEEGLSHYLTLLVAPAPETLFKNIYKLEPGHRMVIESDGRVAKERYWDPLPPHVQPSIDLDGQPVSRSPLVDAPVTEEAAIRTIRSLFRQSIKDRMMSDVPFGVFLSGGIDSSTNVALMAEHMNRPVDTFSVGFRGLERYNELEYARQIASTFSTNHHEILIDQRDALDSLPTLIHHQDEPLADPVSIPLYFVSRLARSNGTIVVQVGEGSDEQFAGYPAMARELRFYQTLWTFYRALPALIRKLGYRAARAYLDPRHSYLLLDYVRKAAGSDQLFWGGAINFTETHKEHLLSPRLRHRSPNTHDLAQRWHEEILRSDPQADYLKRMIMVEFKHRLPELLLMRVDKMSMAASVESRVPFLDHRLVEYSIHVPARLKLRRGQTKYILKKAVEGIIPENIIYRRKQGFAAPVTEWLRGPWKGLAETTLFNSSFARLGYLNLDFVRSLFSLHVAGKQNVGQNLWNLMNLALWYEHWIS